MLVIFIGSIQTDFETIDFFQNNKTSIRKLLSIIFRRNGHLCGGFLDNLRRISQPGCQQSRCRQFWMDHHPVESIGRARRNRYRDERFRLRVGFDFRDGTSTGVPRRQAHVLGATEEQFPTDQKERGELDRVLHLPPWCNKILSPV